jgi:hypothetical protein
VEQKYTQGNKEKYISSIVGSMEMKCGKLLKN